MSTDNVSRLAWDVACACRLESMSQRAARTASAYRGACTRTVHIQNRVTKHTTATYSYIPHTALASLPPAPPGHKRHRTSRAAETGRATVRHEFQMSVETSEVLPPPGDPISSPVVAARVRSAVPFAGGETALLQLAALSDVESDVVAMRGGGAGVPAVSSCR